MIEIVEELEKLSLEEILGYVIESEEAAKKYYLELAKNAPELVATRFENLAREEEMHKKTVSDIYRTRFGDEKYTVPKGLSPLESSVKIDNIITLIEALDNAMRNEYNAHRVYKYLAVQMKEHKKLFAYLADMEMSHYETVKKERDMYEGQIISNPKMQTALPRDLWLETFKIQ